MAARTGGTPPREGPIARIAAIGAGITSASLDEQALAAARLLIADGIAVALAGSLDQAPQSVAALVREMGCRSQASV